MKNKTDEDLAKILWDFNKVGSEIADVDCIIALGSHDTRVAQRGADLYLDGRAPYILFSGGFGRLTAKEWTKPEAEIFSEIAIQMGVPEDKILIENKSTNTGENIDYSLKLLKECELPIKKVILVTKPYMERRAYAAFLKRTEGIEVLMASPEVSFEDYPNETISKKEMINIMVGDTQRIRLYPAKGFMIPQDIPNEVWEAYEELVKRGYTTQLVKD